MIYGALELADDLDKYVPNNQIAAEAAAELRRQHEEIERLHESNTANFQCNKELAMIVRVLCATYGHPLPEESIARSNAAIATATGVTKE
jgi:hypothetical protein